MTNKIDISAGRYWDRAWSLVEGCTPVSAACDHCWLASMDYRMRPHLHVAKAVDTGRIAFTGIVKCHSERLDMPRTVRKSTVFAIWSDLFHDQVPDKFIASAYTVMRSTPHHTFLVLTKRPERMADYLDDYEHWNYGVQPHIWHGITIENQENAGRLMHMLRIKGRRFLSMEPLLGPVDLSPYLVHRGSEGTGANFHAVIVGGESGPGYRIMLDEWAVDIQRQCEMYAIPFFFKQHSGGVKKAGRRLLGKHYDSLPWYKGGK